VRDGAAEKSCRRVGGQRSQTACFGMAGVYSSKKNLVKEVVNVELTCRWASGGSGLAAAAHANVSALRE
jgi:precorrin isomerase